MLVIVDDQPYYRITEVGRYQRKYPLQIVKKGHSPISSIRIGRAGNYCRSSDGDH
jgi:hypothetical protein